MFCRFAVFATFAAAVMVSAFDGASPCEWYGTAPVCSGNCDLNNPYHLAIGSGGGGNGAHCNVGNKVLCCPRADIWTNCAWEGRAPFCKGECSNGKVQIATDSSGDGSHCVSGNKVLCCNKGSSFEDEVEEVNWNTGMRIVAKVAKNGWMN
ncbi:hypothetical protein RhiJN_23415 [Ceratobasidium sp. AG-Ba]|nr:hypothetical protein RhiJN_23415 [Ceratobasidium sp. AG-Ba]